MSPMLPRKISSDQPYTLSFFGTIATAGAFIIYLFSTTWEPSDMNSFIIMTFILLSGIVLSALFVGFRLMPFSLKNLAVDLISTVASFMALLTVNSLVLPSNLGVSPISQQMFLILSGVAEEWFFRMWLCAWVYRVTRMMIVAIPLSSVVWALFHLARYGASMNLIWMVALAGIPLGFFTLYFKSADGPMFAHMLVNALVV